MNQVLQIHNSADLVADIKLIIEQARKQAYASIKAHISDMR